MDKRLPEGVLIQIILHELQHGIQLVEGFDRGGNPVKEMGGAGMLLDRAIEGDPEAVAIVDKAVPGWKDKHRGVVVQILAHKLYRQSPGEFESRTIEQMFRERAPSGADPRKYRDRVSSRYEEPEFTDNPFESEFA